MAIENTHQLSKYYDYFRDREIVFTKANIKSLKLDPRQIYVKCNGSQWPCLINSSSLQDAKIIVGTNSGAFAEMAKQKGVPVNLRYCFLTPSNQQILFFVNCVVNKICSYQNSKELALIYLDFTQRPPDDLISRIGEFIEANENFKNRKEDRIEINENSLRKLSIEKEETMVVIDNVPRRSILKDLSFGGAKIMLVGVPKFLINKPISIKIAFTDTNDDVMVQGIVQNAEFLAGRKDIVSANISFNQDFVPMSYKIHINNYITSFSKTMLKQQHSYSDFENSKDSESKIQIINQTSSQSDKAEHKVQAAKSEQPIQSEQPVQSEQPKTVKVEEVKKEQVQQSEQPKTVKVEEVKKEQVQQSEQPKDNNSNQSNNNGGTVLDDLPPLDMNFGF